MIDTAIRCKNPSCGKPITPQLRGHRPREYCNDTCKQTAYRLRKQHPHHGVTIVDDTSAELEQRIAQLEQENAALQERLNIEQRFRTDYQVRHFKSWLRKHPQAQDTDFAKRFIADTRLPEHASRGLYGAHLRLYKYSEKDMYLFQEAWKDMIFTQS